MKRAKLTYGQLDKALRSLGFSCRLDESNPPTRVYEHDQSGAIVMLPVLPRGDRVYNHHVIAVRITLDNFGIPIPTLLDGKLRQAS